MVRRPSRLLAVAVAALVLVQAVGLGVAAAGVQADGTTSAADGNASAADEVYVEDDGDVVLVYDGSTDGLNRTEFGVDVTENLAYLLVEEPVEGTPEVEGGLAASANRTAIVAAGNLSAPRPDSLETLDLDASGVTTTETSRADLSLSTTWLDETGLTQAVASATTNGTVTTTADRLTVAADLEADVAIPMPQSARESLDFSLRETDDAYVVSIDQSRSVDPRFGTAPTNRSQAARTLEFTYGSLAQQLGGSASVDLESFETSEEGDRVRVQQTYTARLEGIDDGIGEMLRADLADDPEVSGERVDALANAIEDVDIDELRVEYAVDADGLTGSLAVDVGNYGPLATAYFELVGSLDGAADVGADVERMEQRFEAQQAANLEQRFTWSGNLTHPDSERVSADLEMATRTDNWEAYVDELRDRDVPILESRYELDGSVADDRVEFEGDLSVSGDRLYAELLRGVPESTDASSNQPMLDAIRDSRPETARLVTTYGEDGFHLEAGAAFGNLSALRDAVAERADLPTVTEAVGRFDQGSGETTVRVASAVSADASESSVRALPAVDDGTTIYMPGEGDREFPSMDVERAETFLEQASVGSGPGFGAFAAIVALLGAAFLLVRRE